MRAPRARATVLVWLAGVGISAGAPPRPPEADLIFVNAHVRTMDPARPTAEAIAAGGGRILKVGSTREVLALRRTGTEVIDLGGRLVLPGFIDAHTHFENAADWAFNLSLYAVADERELLRQLGEAVARIPAGMWITGGDWGAYEAWDAGRAGRPLPHLLEPGLARVDAVAPNHPVVLRRHDGAYLVNSEALRRARWTRNTPDPRGGRLGRDPSTGELTGMLHGRAAERLVQLMPPPSLERKLVGARLALVDLARNGITSIHDITRNDALSQATLHHTHVERSFSDDRIFHELRRRNQLTVRVYAIEPLQMWDRLASVGIKPGGGDEWIRYGALKAFIDGRLMMEPLSDNPKDRGDFTFRFKDEATIRRDILGAHRAGFDVAVHTIGDKAHQLLLDWFDEASRSAPSASRRHRIVHAWYMTPEQVARAGRLNLVVDVTPEHLVEQLADIDRQLGPERAATAFPWRSLHDAGARMNIVSDWPGSYNEQVPTPLSPLENIYYAVTRRKTVGPPPGGWHPEQSLTIGQAVAAYTVNPAFASHEEEVKGSLRAGKLADLVVLSKDILAISVDEIPTAEVLYTVVGGRIVYRKGPG